MSVQICAHACIYKCVKNVFLGTTKACQFPHLEITSNKAQMHKNNPPRGFKFVFYGLYGFILRAWPWNCWVQGVKRSWSCQRTHSLHIYKCMRVHKFAHSLHISHAPRVLKSHGQTTYSTKTTKISSHLQHLQSPDIDEISRFKDIVTLWNTLSLLATTNII